MNKTKRLPLILLASIALTGCEQQWRTRSSDTTSDPALRMMLGIRSISGTFVLPRGEDYYEIAVCCFEDGKQIRRNRFMCGDKVKFMENRRIRPQLLWGMMGGKMTVLVTTDGCGGPHEDTFWSKLDGPHCWKTGSSKLDVTPDGDIVLGYACSQICRDPSWKGVLLGSLKHQLEASKYVGALVVRTFKTKDEWFRAMNFDKKATQEAPKDKSI